jgi:glyoxylase-like metal-dependent hydrolase (beta-lactamase superfamily II)
MMVADGQPGTATMTRAALGGRRAEAVLPPRVDAFFEPRTCSVQYVVSDPATGECAIIDPVLDYDEKSGSIATVSADALLAHVAEHGFHIAWILDTHPHADHLSAAGYLEDLTGAPIAIGERIVDIQTLWKAIYHLADAFPTDGSQWDRLFADQERFAIGSLTAEVMFSPGHTLASITYVIGDAAFVHDTLLMPDYGTARCDFPGGDARQLWRTLQRILALPDATRLFTGHDYRPGGREPRWESTVAEQRASNIHLRQARTEAEFVAIRRARDATLAMPKLILHALQVNIAGGRLPAPESNGKRFLKMPLDALPGAKWD